MKKPSRKIIAERLDALMKSTPALSTQVKLAKKSGVGQTTIGRVRRAEVDASAENIRKIAGAFGLTAGYLYGEGGSATDEAGGSESIDPGEARLLQIYWDLPEAGTNSRDWLLKHAEMMAAAVGTAQQQAPEKDVAEVKPHRNKSAKMGRMQE